MSRLSNISPSLALLAGALTGALTFAAATPFFRFLFFAVAATAAAFYFRSSTKDRVLLLTGFCVAAATSWLRAPTQLEEGLFGIDSHRLAATVDAARAGKAGQNLIVIADSLDGLPCRPFRARVVVRDIVPAFQEGQRIDFSAVLAAPTRYAAIDHLSMRDYFNRAERLSATMTVDADSIGVTGRRGGLRYTAAAVRRSCAEKVYGSGMSSTGASLLVAACLGGDGTDADSRVELRAAGIAHLLCVSGFHVALFAAVLSVFMLPFGVWSRYGVYGFFLLVAAVWVYAYITGLSPSVQRAAIMVTAYYLCRVAERPARAGNALALSVAVILMVNPYVVYSVGFQLSVAAVAGIIIFADRLNPVRMRIFGLYKFFEMLCVPVAVMLTTLPLTLLWFHSVPLLGVPANILAAVLFPVFLLLGATACFASHTGVFANFFCGLADSFAKSVTGLCGTAPNIDNIYLPPVAAAALLAAVGALIAAVLFRKRGHRYAAVAVMGSALLLCGCTADRRSYAMVDGSLFATELHIFAPHGHYAASSRPKIRNNPALPRLDGYLTAAADSVRLFEAGGRRILFADRNMSPAAELPDSLDYIIIDSSYGGDAAALLRRVRAHTAAIGFGFGRLAVIDAEMAAIEGNMRFVRLWDEALQIDLNF